MRRGSNKGQIFSDRRSIAGFITAAAIFAILLMPFNTQKAAPSADPLAAIYQRPHLYST
jgi:hypothetical protein